MADCSNGPPHAFPIWSKVTREALTTLLASVLSMKRSGLRAKKRILSNLILANEFSDGLYRATKV